MAQMSKVMAMMGQYEKTEFRAALAQQANAGIMQVNHHDRIAHRKNRDCIPIIVFSIEDPCWAEVEQGHERDRAGERVQVSASTEKDSALLYVSGIDGEVRHNYRGEVYSGSMLHGQPHGRGIITKMNGDMFMGQFDSGRYHGRGRLVRAVNMIGPQRGGEHTSGTWNNGKLLENTCWIEKISGPVRLALIYPHFPFNHGSSF
jgi:hypothetical protein